MSAPINTGSASQSFFNSFNISPALQNSLFADSSDESDQDIQQPDNKRFKHGTPEKTAVLAAPVQEKSPAKTDEKMETSFRTFLSASKNTGSAITTKKISKQPPPSKKEVKHTPQERIDRRRGDLKEKHLSFLHAALKATNSIENFHPIGEGSFSKVYLVPASQGVPATVKKVFKDDASTASTLRPLQGTVRLYKLAKACEEQFKKIRNAYTEGAFPVDVLDILNIDTWRKDGVITQPFVSTMFQPFWETFLTKISTDGNQAQITDEEERLLKTIQEVFQKSIELGLCIDFKPDNLGLVNIQGQNRLVIIDTFGLSGKDPSNIPVMTQASIREFSKGNSIIQSYLLQGIRKV